MNTKNKRLFPLVLAFWLLVKIGDLTKKLPLFIFSKLQQILNFILKTFKNYSLKNFSKPSPVFKINLQKIHLPKFLIFKRKKARGRPKNKFKKNWLLPLSIKLSLILVIFVSLFFVYSYFIFNLAAQLPSPEKLSDSSGPMTTTFLDRHDRVLYRLYEDKNRFLVKLEDLPQHLINATIAIEDKNFYKHQGVDFEGITRAAYENFKNKQEMQGGSTITQQLIKNTLLTPDRTIKRKVKEVILAFWAERLFSKQQILQMYFNEVPYGGPAWGIAAASQTYFGKNPQELNLAESAYLAGLPASPTSYSPYGANPQSGKMRQKEVLRRMVEDHYITQTQAEEAYNAPINIKAPISEIKAPHFVMYLKSELSQKYGERVVTQGGLKVKTTLDLDLQQMAETVVAEEIEKLKGLDVGNGAAMITDAQTGQILAMIGSKNYWDDEEGKFNVATALRQPGSSIKPITYATAFKQGYTPGTILLDTPVVFRNAWESYAPVNYDGKFHGPVSIRTALGSSYNIPAVKMLSLVGIDNMLQTAKEMGITSLNERDRYGLSLTLGGGEVTLLDMMSVYGTFSQNGVKYAPQAVLTITDSQGNIVQDNTVPEGKKVISEAVAYLVTHILADNRARTPAFGPNSLLNIPGHQVAVKTGTTDNKRDNWCFGYTPKYVVGAWVGNNNNSPMRPGVTSGVTGATPIWSRIMTNLVKDQPSLAFERPATVLDGIVNGNRDLVIAGITPKNAIAQKPSNSPDGKTTITFTDPFSTYTIDQPNR